MLKGQDIVVFAALMGDRRSDESYADLGARTGISASEAHAAVRRLREAGLIGADRRVHRRNAAEFLLHGLKYVFPIRVDGRMAKGLPTSYAAPVAKGAFAVSGNVPVWQTPSGEVHGLAIAPLYPTAPEAASRDCKLYDVLAVFDMLRGGRLRERQFAEHKIMKMLQ